METFASEILATTQLPAGYGLKWRLDLRRSIGLYVLLNLIGLFLLFATGWLVTAWVSWLRPADLTGAFSWLEGEGNLWRWAGMLLGVSIGMLLVHEGLHGLFFWIYTRQAPHFGIGPGYFYACAPQWYIPRRQALVIMLTPAVGITLGGLLALAILPAGWLLPIALLVALNLSGAVGDLYVAARSVRLPPESLYHDTGHVMEVYCLEQGNASSQEIRNPELPNTEEG
jgi:hypothetical protein